MNDLSKKTCLIIPCYNEARRLLENKIFTTTSVYLLFVNDGSKDNTAGIIKDHIKPNIFFLDLEKNKGKAEAVRQGMLHLKTLPVFKKIDWIGYWDADLSTPLQELPNFFKYCSIYNNDVDAIFGIRVLKFGSIIKRSLIRHYSGRLFTTLIDIILKLKVYDSQCGAKIFRKDLLNMTFDEPFISRWIFDIEIIFRLGEKRIIEYPLNEWYHIPNGSLNIVKETVPVLQDIFKIRKRYLQNSR